MLGFDLEKLPRMNYEHLRALPMADYRERAVAAGVDSGATEDYIAAALGTCRDKVKQVDDLPTFCSFYFTDEFDYGKPWQPRPLRRTTRNPCAPARGVRWRRGLHAGAVGGGAEGVGGGIGRQSACACNARALRLHRCKGGPQSLRLDGRWGGTGCW